LHAKNVNFVGLTDSPIKKFLKILGWTLLVILTLVIAAGIAAQLPGVQTWVANTIAPKLEEKFDAEVSFGKFHFKPFNTLVINDITIKDTNPWKEEGSVPIDTFFNAGSISAKFNLTGLLRGEGVNVREITVTDGVFAFVNEGETTNLQRILHLESGKKKDKKEKSGEVEYFKASHVNLNNMRFIMKNYNHPHDTVEGKINWSDLDIRNINLKGKRMSFKGKVMGGTVESLSFSEKSGYTVKSFSGKAEVGNGKASLEDLKLDDGMSRLDLPTLLFSYEGNPSAWSDFVNEVRITAKAKQSHLELASLGYFAKGLQDKPLGIDFSTGFDGPVSNFRLSSFNFTCTDADMEGSLDGRIRGLPDIDAMTIDFSTDKLAFTTDGLSKFIKGWSPGSALSLGGYAPGTKFTFAGDVKGKLSNLKVAGNIDSDQGNIDADITLRNLIDKYRDISVGGALAMHSVDAGNLLGIESLGVVSMNSNLSLSLGKGGISASIDTVAISRLGFLGHDYEGLSLTGKFEDNAFNGRVRGRDEALDLDLDAVLKLPGKDGDASYRVNGEVRKADLHAMNLDKRGPSALTAKISADLSQNEKKMFTGEAALEDVSLSDSTGVYDLGNINLTSGVEDGVNHMRLYSSFLEASYDGTAFIDQFINDIQEVTLRKELSTLGGGRMGNSSGDSYKAEIVFKHADMILPFIKKGTYIADGTVLGLSLEGEALDATLKSQRIAYMRNYLKDMELNLNNAEEALSAVLDAGETKVSALKILDNRLTAYADDNRLGVSFSFDNNTDAANKGDLYISSELSRSELGNLDIDAGFLPSAIWLNDDVWNIADSGISFHDKRLSVNQLSFESEGQSFFLDGAVSDLDTDVLNLGIDNFNLGTLGSMAEKFGLEGILNGLAELHSPVKDKLDLSAIVQTDSTYICGEKAGQLFLTSFWLDDEKMATFSLDNSLDGKSHITGEGSYAAQSKNVEGRVHLDSLNAGYAYPFLNSLFSQMGGSISGTVAIDGPMDNLEISSQGLQIDDADLTLDFTKVPYKASGPLRLDNNGLWFENLKLSDRYGGSGSVNGGIKWDRLKNFNLDTRVNFERMEVLNLTASDNDTFYGNLTGSGRVGITGPFKAIFLDIEAQSTREGTFHLPLEGGSVSKSTDLLTFKEPEVEKVIDPYELMIATIESETKKASDLGVKLTIGVDNGVQAYIELDKEGGNVLTARGNGNIELEVRPARSVFSMGGAYNLTEGSFRFDQLGLVKRDFSIQDGSSVHFNGGIMDTDLDIEAVYKTKAMIGTLISDSNSSTRRTVECLIDISGKLKDPEVELSVNVPDLDPATQALVESALNSKDREQKQFVALLVTGSFLPDDQSGIVNNTSMLSSTLPEMMARKLSDVLQKMNIPVDLGLDLSQTSSGSELFDVAVSTELFGNRVVVNGSVGNREYGTSSSTDEVVGDLDIEIKLDKSGDLRMTLFSHSADQYTNYLDNSQRNGVGVAYQREFNRLKDFFRTLFKGGSHRRAEEAALELASREEEKVKITIDE